MCLLGVKKTKDSGGIFTAKSISGLAVGALDQFVVRFRGPVSLRFGTVEHLLQQNLQILNAVLANVGSPV